MLKENIRRVQVKRMKENLRITKEKLKKKFK